MKATLMNQNIRAAGFSFIELLIVLVIIGVMFKVGMSSYQGFKDKKVREDAINKIEQLDTRQKQYQKANQQFARRISQLKMEPLTEKGDYRVSVVNGKWNRYILQADPAAEGTTGKMAEDGKFRLTHDGVKTWDCNNDGSFSCSWEDAIGEDKEE